MGDEWKRSRIKVEQDDQKNLLPIFSYLFILKKRYTNVRLVECLDGSHLDATKVNRLDDCLWQ